MAFLLLIPPRSPWLMIRVGRVTPVTMLRLKPVEFRAYVSGIYGSQLLQSQEMNVAQAWCAQADIGRSELAGIVRSSLLELPEDVMSMPSRVAAFSILIEKLHCPGIRWETRQ